MPRFAVAQDSPPWRGGRFEASTRDDRRRVAHGPWTAFRM